MNERKDSVDDKGTEDTADDVLVTPALTLAERSEEFEYTVEQNIPTDALTIEVSDELEDVLTVIGTPTLKLRYETGTETELRSALVTVDGNKVTAKLEGGDAVTARGARLILSINAKIRDTVSDEDLIAKYGSTNIPNKADVIINDKPLVTNTVHVTPPPSPEKEVNGQKAPYALDNRGEEFEYTVKQVIPENAINVVFEDTLVDVLEFVEPEKAAVTYVDDDGVTQILTREGITTSGQNIKAELTNRTLLSTLYNKEVVLSFKAKIKDTVSDDDLKQYTIDSGIPNRAKVTINSDPRTSNEVQVIPPQDPEKKVNDQKDIVVVNNRDETFTYTVHQVVPNQAKSVTFEDVLKDVLETSESEISVLVGGKELTGDSVTKAYDSDTNTVTASLTLADENGVQNNLGAQVAGKEVVLEIIAKIRADVTDEELLSNYRDESESVTAIPNQATVKIDDEPKTTNEVIVTKPRKTVNDVTEVKLETRPEQFTYKVMQLVPENATKIELLDELESVLEIIGEPTLEAGDRAAFTGGTIVTDGNKVTATIEGDDAVAVRGQVITLVINAKIKDDVTDAQLIAKYGKIQVPNQATVTINDKPKDTNEVLVIPPDNPQEDPEKFINGETGTVELASRLEQFTYTVVQKVPTDAVSVKFEDTLESVLEIIGMPEISSEVSFAQDGINVSVDSDANKVTAVLNQEASIAARGKYVTLTIKARIRSGVSDDELIAKYGNTQVPNKATVTINDDPKNTNEVKVTPPNGPEKEINGQKGTVYLKARDEQFTYTVTQMIPENAAKAVFEDTLEDVLEIVGRPTVDANGASVQTDGNKVTATLEGNALKNYWGRQVTLTIVAKIKEDVTDDQLRNLFNDTTEIPNEATVTINDDPKTTNEVKVTPPPAPEKEVNGQKGTVVLTNRADTFTYTVKQIVPDNATSMTFTDTLEDVLQFVSTASDATLKVGSADVDNAAIAIDGQTITATAADASTLSRLAGREMILTFQAKINNDVKDADLIEKYGSTEVPNEARVTINDNPQTTNEVKVTPPKDPEKEINGQKEPVYLGTSNEEFTYTVRYLVPGDADTVTITDALEDVLEVVGTPTVTTADNAIDGAQVTTSGTTVTAVLAGDAAESVRNKEIVLTIVTRVKADVTSEQLIEKYGVGEQIPNVANVKINDDPNGSNTNKVIVVPPNDPEKFINGQKDLVELPIRDQAFTYTVTQKIPANATEVVFEDIVEEVLEILGGDQAPTLSAAGADISVDGNMVTATLKGDAAVDARDTVVTLTINAKIKEDVTDEQLIRTYGEDRHIPNKATVTINNNPKVTNEVEVVPPYEEENPEKKVNNSTETYELGVRDEAFTYTVSQKIPYNAVSATFEDKLLDVLEIIGDPSIDAEGGEVTVNGNSVTATLGETAAIAARGKVVTLTIVAKIRDDVSDRELLERFGDSREIPNTADVMINGNDPKTTNEVLVTPPEPEDPEKEINGHKGSETLTTRNQEFTYTVNQKVPANAQSIVFEDTLEDVLEVVGTPSVNLDGAERAVTVDGNHVRAELTGDLAEAAQNKMITLTIHAKIRDNVTDADLIAKYGSREVPNDATVTIDDTPKATNEVKVTPPNTDEDPEKRINNQTDPVKLRARDELFTYTVRQIIPADATSITFTDTLEDVLEVVGDPIMNTAGAEVSTNVNANGTTTVTGELTGDAAIDARGQLVILTIVARIKSDVTDEDLIAQYGDGRQVPNVATITINDNTKTTNEVLVTPPDEPDGPEDDQPEKKVNDHYGREKLSARDEEFVYTITDEIPADASEIAFSDTLEDVLEIVGTPTITYEDGSEITPAASTDSTESADGTDETVQANTLDDASNGTDAGSEPYSNTYEFDTGSDDASVNTNSDSYVDTYEFDTGDSNTSVNTDSSPEDASVDATNTDSGIDSADDSTPAESEINLQGDDTDSQDGVQIDAETVSARRIPAFAGTANANHRAVIAQAAAYATAARTVSRAVVTADTEAAAADKTVGGSSLGDAIGNAAANAVEEIEIVMAAATGNAGIETAESSSDIEIAPADGTLSAQAEGSAETGIKEVDVNGNTVTATLTGSYAEAVRGKRVTLTIRARIKADVTDDDLIAKYGTTDVPNEASVKINGDDPKVTNKVLVTPPYEEQEPEKEVDNQKNPVTLAAREQKFTYTVSQRITDDAASVTFTDKLESVLEIIRDPELDAAGAEINVDGNTVTAKLTGTAAEAARGKVVTLTIVAKIRAGVTDEQLIAMYGSTDVPNKATVQIGDDGEAKQTNEVIVTPPEEPENDPEKKINGQTDRVTLAARSEEFTYTISQRIPADALRVVFEDTLEDILEIVGTPTVDFDGAQVEVDGNKVTATLSGVPALKARDQVVTLTIHAKIKADVTDEALIAKYGSTIIPNKAAVTINDKPAKETNVVEVTPPDRENPVKQINGGTDKVTLAARSEVFTYTVSQKVPEDATKVVFEDILEEVLEVVGTPTVNVDGAQVLAKGNYVTASLVNDAAVSARGKVAILTINAKIKNDVTDEELISRYGSARDIPNTAGVSINDAPKTTNEVLVTPPEDDETPVKKINGSTDKVSLASRTEKFTYTVSQKIPMDATKVVFEDTLEDVLEIVGKPAFSANNAKVKVSGNAVTATLSGDTAVAARGQVVTLTIVAKIKDSVTDEQLIAKYGSTDVPNKATVTVNDKAKTTNEVRVNPPEEPAIPQAPEKRINGQKSKVTLAARNETFTYTISQKIPTNAETIVFADTLEDVLEIIGKPSVDAKGAKIKVDGNKVTATLSGRNAEAVRGTTVTLTIQAKIRDSVTDSALIAKYGSTNVPNRAAVTINDVGQTTNEVQVTPPNGSGTPDKTTTNNGGGKSGGGSSSSSNVKTGDTNHVGLWLTLMLLAGAAAVVVLIRRRRNRAE